MTSMRIRPEHGRAGIAGLAVLIALGALSACGANPSAARNQAPSGLMTMPDGTVMSNAQMGSGPSTSDQPSSPMATGSGPSATAQMICTADTAGAVKRNLVVPATPARQAHWSDQTYTCDYALPGGTLKLSVKDLDSTPAGRAWFDTLRKQLPGASDIAGMANFGLPAYETTRGDVVFLKDGKTLWVDASALPAAVLPPGATRTGVAYAVAAAVIACWKG